MMVFKLLGEGDSVIEINDRFVAVRRKNEEVDIFKAMYTEDGEFYIDPVKIAVISHGDAVVTRTSEDGEITYFEF